MVLFVAPTSALACYGPNFGSYVEFDANQAITGVRGKMDHVAAAVPSGDFIAHPYQVYSGVSSDFIGWGTAIGEGTHLCPDYYGPNWQLYIDGWSFGTYFCRQTFGSIAANAASQVVKLEYGWCPQSPVGNKWLAYFNGSLKTCQAVDFVSSPFTEAGGETTWNGLRTDIRYKLMDWRQGISTWKTWSTGSGTWNACNEFPYFIDWNSDGIRDFWAMKQ